MGERVTPQEAAQQLGLNRSTVWRQASAMGLMGADKRFDLEEYLRRRAQDLNPLKARSGPLLGAEPAEPAAAEDAYAPAPEAATPAPGGRAAPSGLQGAAVAHKALQARKIQLDIEERMGRLVRRTEIAEKVGAAGRVLKGQLLSMPALVAGELAQESDPDRVEQVLTARVNEALGRAVEQLRALARSGEEAVP